jgi:hypothetical protein
MQNVNFYIYVGKHAMIIFYYFIKIMTLCVKYRQKAVMLRNPAFLSSFLLNSLMFTITVVEYV